MEHNEVWEKASQVETETCRYVGVSLTADDLPEWLFAIDRPDGFFDIYVERPTLKNGLPISHFVVLLAPYKVCQVLHAGHENFPTDEMRLAIQNDANLITFCERHTITFCHTTTEGVKELNVFELRGLQYAINPESSVAPEVFWTYMMIRTCLEKELES